MAPQSQAASVPYATDAPPHGRSAEACTMQCGRAGRCHRDGQLKLTAQLDLLPIRMNLFVAFFP